ncbi:MAG: ribonuclease inhibitor [Verrucomicrobia bacterium]|nr:ribonuclease inhibitor [Verrucomicrobiota bacterium]
MNGSPPESPESHLSERQRRPFLRPWQAVALPLIATAPVLLMLAERLPWAWLAPFLGRFHPVVLHFPIVLLLLAGCLEILQIAGRGRWEFPVTLVLFLGATGAVTAMALGWLLMRADAVTGGLIEAHERDGIIVAVLAVVTLSARLLADARRTPLPRWAGRALLAVTGVMLFRTSHEGARVTHGEEYLEEHAPWFKPKPKTVFAFPLSRPVLQWDLYAHVVTPILQARCYECHAARKAKGGLLLDSWANVQRGGKTGGAVVPAKPDESLLFQRINLPFEHHDHMPPRRKSQLSAEEMALLRRWILLGAPAQGTLGSLHLDNRLVTVVGQLPGLLLDKNAVVPDASDEEPDPAAVAKLRGDLAGVVAEMQARYPQVVAYESRQSGDLEMNAAVAGKSFGDADLAAVGRVAGRIVWADFSGTAITDRSAAVVAAMKRLRVLRLGRTAVTDLMAPALGKLAHLESLNLFGTAVTPALLPAIAPINSLRRVYVGETRIASDAACPEGLRGKILFPATFSQARSASPARRAKPAKLVVLTFDDAVKSHLTVVAPLLRELGFRATFFITPRWMGDQSNFLTWAEVGQLHRMGFEIGNHSWTHADFGDPNTGKLLGGELQRVEAELAKVGVPKPISFAWSGNAFGPEGIEELKKHGYQLARRGMQPEVLYGAVKVGPALDVRRHHPLLIPTTGDAYPAWTLEHFKEVVASAQLEEIVVLTFHGVPDPAHPWVSTPQEKFHAYMMYLKEAGFTAIALRELANYYDLSSPPADRLLGTRSGRDAAPPKP